MKKASLIIIMFLLGNFCFSQQKDWSGIENVFGKKGMVQNNGFKISFPRSDLKVNVNGFTVAPGFALGSWVGFLEMNNGKNMKGMITEVHMMGDLVLLDTEVPGALKKLTEENLKITAIHNHLINESPNVKYVHFSGTGDAVKLAEAIKAVLQTTATPLTASQPAAKAADVDWSKVEAILGAGKHNGQLLQYSFPRKEKLTEDGMVTPPFMGMATGINFQKEGDSAAITGDFVLLADEINPVIKILIANGITPTALHNHMIHDVPRLFMMHFWAVGVPAQLAQGLEQALKVTNHVPIKK
ncbi:MAG: DUF1259 domain-containing protein [Ginsengibacter sp.]